MTCADAGRQSEYDYVRSTVGREPDECRGPLLTLSFPGFRLNRLEESLPAEAIGRLWDGFRDGAGQITFTRCAAHWMDLSYQSGMNARMNARTDWFNEATQLLRMIFAAARWDGKEMSNLLAWQRVQLT